MPCKANTPRHSENGRRTLMARQRPMTRFALLRHGKTEWNQKKRIQGQEDSPLASEGRNEAGQWGFILKDIRWDRILTSDLGRAMETATLINKTLKVPLVEDSRLREQDWGKWTGKTVAQLKEEDGSRLVEQIDAGWRFCPPGGEDRKSVLVRSREAIRTAAETWTGETILVVTHEGVIKCLIYQLTGRAFLPSEPSLIRENTIHWLFYDDSGLKIDKINVPLTHHRRELNK
jgi:broad specificity phosphatase PhoE